MAIDPREEAVRKGIHLFLSLIAAGVVWVLPPLTAATVLAGATTAALAVEVARGTSVRFAGLFHRRLEPLLRDRETRRLTGATTLAIGYTFVATVLPGTPALLGILVAGVADAVAAVVGKRYGRVRYPGGKSLEGSLAFLVVVYPLVLLLTGSSAPAALVVALALTLIEAPSLPVDDNLYLPLAAGFVVHAAPLLTGLTFFS